MNSTTTEASRRRLLRRVTVGLFLAALAAVANVATSAGPAAGVSLPLPIYSVDTFAPGHHHQFIGVLGVPILADVDGDLIPDVDIVLSLVNIEGINNPPDLSKIITGTLTITRDPIAVTLGRPAPPLKVLANISFIDSSTLKPSNQVSVGYDTGPGGSIPEHFDASIGGFTTGFNPFTATVDTVGGISGLTTNLLPPRPPTYEGPLTLLTNIGLPSVEQTDLALHYQPFPGLIQLTYGTNASGSHIGYAHNPSVETHLTADVKLHGPARAADTTITADVDRLPPAMQVDLQTADTSGALQLTQTSSGRKPDVGFTFLNLPKDGSAPMAVQGNIAALPRTISAQWSLDPDAPTAVFNASGAGLGAVDLLVQDYIGAPTVIEPFVPSEPQFVSYQKLPGGAHGSETEIRAHVEHIRHLDFAKTGTAITANAQVGDGVMPLQVNYLTDTRQEDPEGSLLRANATVAPLPSNVDLALDLPGGDLPIKVVVDTDQPADIRGHVEILPVGGGAGCGDTKNICADVSLRHLPQHIDVTFGKIDAFGQGVEIDSTPTPGGLAPDVSADVILGPGVVDIPALAGTPIIASVDLDRISPRVSARLHNDANGAMDRAEFHACDWDYTADPPACETTSADDQIGQVAFTVRNFTEANRPADVVLPVFDSPQYASVVSRKATTTSSILFEASGQLRKVADIELRNTAGILGLRTQIGGGQDFAAHVDVDDPLRTVVADATVTPLPPSLDFCFREDGSVPTATAGAPFTEACEVENPFAEDPTPEASPLSFHFDAPDPFGIDADVLFVDKTATPDQTTKATLDSTAVPEELTAHVRMGEKADDPADCADPNDCLPTRVHYDIPADAPPTTLVVTAQSLKGDAICKDPRAGEVSSCIAATLENIPTSVDICQDPNNLGHCDPDNPRNNLVVLAGTGAQPFNIKDLELSTVGVEDTPPHAPTALIATGDILGVPEEIRAAIGENAFDITATPPIGEIDAEVRNYIAPDPMAGLVIPAQRAGLPAPSSQFGAFLRGDLFKAILDLKQVSGAGYSASVNALGEKLKTAQLTVGFDPGQPVRGYADIVSGDDGSHTIGDLTIENNPTALSLCFRGEDAAAPTAVNPSWCDNMAPDPGHRGAFEVKLLNAADNVNVHAFLRQLDDSGTQVINAVADINDVPDIVRGTMGKRTTEVAGFDADGTTPEGIGVITFNVADYDLPAADTGYINAPLPEYTPGPVPGAPFPTPVLTGAYLSATATDTHFQARGSIGSSGAHVQRVLFSDSACAKPDPNRDDYPFFPTNPDTSYTCVRGDITKDGGVGATPLNLHANIQTANNSILLSNAGLTDMPSWFQATISQSPTLNANTSLKRRCGAVGGTNPDSDNNCMPALLRFDTATQATPPTLFGQASFSGSATGAAQLATLVGTPPQIPFLDGVGNPIDLNEDPAAGWGGDTGVRLRVGQFEQASGSSATVVQAGLRLSLPGSFTLDQLQSYSDSTTDDPPTYSANDIRAHFIARTYATNPNGSIVPSLGNLSALIATFDTSNAVTDVIQGQNVQGPGGGPIPGEVGIDVYARGGKQMEGSDPVKKDTYQIDLRLSSPLNVKFHIGFGEGTIAAIDPVIRNIPAMPAGSQPDYVCNVVGTCQPGARVRAELIDGPQQLVTLPPPDPDDDTQATASVHISAINFDIDFRQDAAQTRRIDAVIHLDKAKNGIEMMGFTNVDPAVTTPGLVNITGSLVFDQFDIDLTKTIDGGFPLGDGDVVLHLVSQLSIGFNGGNGNGTSHLRVRQNVLHVTASSADNPSTVGPIDLVIENDADFDMTIDFGLVCCVPVPFPPFLIPIPVFIDVDYDAEAPPVAPIAETWHECADTDNTTSGNSRQVGAAEINEAMEPLNDSRVEVNLELVFDISVKGLVTDKLVEAMCKLDTEVDLVPEGYPADPVNYPQHPVPQMALDPVTTTGPAVPAQPPDDGGTDPGPNDPPQAPDTFDPLSALLTVPDGPDGQAGWFLEQPLGVILALDNAGGDGVASISYRVDAGGPTPYTGPFVIGPGAHSVCWHAEDVAGNVETEQCRNFLVDDAAPALTVAPTGSVVNGWYTTAPTVNVSATDLNSNGGAGSGVAAILTSVDGGPWVSTAGAQALAIPEGLHTVRAYATDVAGHTAQVQTLHLQVDLSRPVTTARTFAPAPARNGWWRSKPLVYLRATDGDQNSGVDRVQYRVDGIGSFLDYTYPVVVGSGSHTVQYRSIDLAGRVEATRSVAVAVDITPPTAIATGPSAAAFIPLLGPARLNFRIGDDLSGPVTVKVLVYNLLGDVARVLPVGTFNVPPGGTVDGFVNWDGKDTTLLALLPIGAYHYSVIATDAAGNSAQSGNSRPIQLSALPILGGLLKL